MARISKREADKKKNKKAIRRKDKDMCRSGDC